MKANMEIEYRSSLALHAYFPQYFLFEVGVSAQNFWQFVITLLDVKSFFDLDQIWVLT